MTYTIGDLIGQYTVTRDFDSANGGQCEWGFAEYNGEEFFIKRFLSPVYPGDLSPGSEKGKEKRKAECQEFERKQLAIINALSACGDGGLVVRTIDCFLYGNDYGSHYFKVSQKVDTSSLSEQVHTLEAKKRLFVMLTAAGALKILHSNGIIHLDLKPDNILIQEYESKLIAKIIDFDSSILDGESVAYDFLVGDPVYYSPEFARHIATKGETPAPNKKSDIFSLGLIFCKYWTGMLPTFSPRYTYPYEAVLNRDNLLIASYDATGKSKTETPKTSRLKISRNLQPKLVTKISTNPIEAAVFQLIEQMIILDTDKRLSIKEVHDNLKHLYHHGTLLYTETKSDTSRSDVSKNPSKIIISKNLLKG